MGQDMTLCGRNNLGITRASSGMSNFSYQNANHIHIHKVISQPMNIALGYRKDYDFLDGPWW